MQIPRHAAFAATVVAMAALASPALAADFAEGGNFGGTYSYIGPGAGYPDYVEVAPVYPAPIYPAPAYVAPGYGPVAPIVEQEILEPDIVPGPPGYYPGPIEPYGDAHVEAPPPGYAAPPPGYSAPPVGYAPPPVIDRYVDAPYDDVTIVEPDPGLAVGLGY